MVEGAVRGLPLRVNFAWTFTGNVVYAACQWGMLVVLAKLGSPEMVGQFALALAVTAPVLMFTNLQLRAVQATDARRVYLFGDYLGLRLLMTLSALLLIGGLVFLSGYTQETALVIGIVGLAKAFEAVSDVFYGLLQQHEQMDRIAISMMLKGVLSLAALTAGVYLTGNLLWGVGGLAAVWALLLVVYDLRSGALVLRRELPEPATPVARPGGPFHLLRPEWIPARLGRLAWMSLPLGIVMMLISLNSNIPRYFLEHYQGTRELGIFAAMAYLVVAENTVIAALGQSASPRLARYHADGNEAAFRSLVLKLIGICSALCIGGVLLAVVAGGPLLTIIYTPEYAAYSDVFVWIMVSAGLLNAASIFGYAATARRHIRYQPLALVFVVAVSGISGYALISTYGLWGAAISMFLSSLAGAIAYFLVANPPAQKKKKVVAYD